MALTATSSRQVALDVMSELGMENVYTHVSCFNRPNLRYFVRTKVKDSVKVKKEITTYVMGRPEACGIIYCSTCRECEELCAYIQDHVRLALGEQSITVSFYHGGLSACDREQRHNQWKNGCIRILCATLAFGMGVDKQDVRYVIHYSLPQSLTHYYQESGRAGRDGEEADCILYYTYKDKVKLESMFLESSDDPLGKATRQKIAELHYCVRYCENELGCRRSCLIQFFGMPFDRSQCNRACDNCMRGLPSVQLDVTEITKQLLELLDDMIQKKKKAHRDKGFGLWFVTLNQLADAYRGKFSGTKDKDATGLRHFGSGTHFNGQDLEHILHFLVYEQILREEYCTPPKPLRIYTYIDYGAESENVLSGLKQVYFEISRDRKKRILDHSVATSRSSHLPSKRRIPENYAKNSRSAHLPARKSSVNNRVSSTQRATNANIFFHDSSDSDSSGN